MNEEQPSNCKDTDDSLCTCCICLESMDINNVARSEKKIEFSWNKKLCKKRQGNGIARQDKRSNIAIINKSDNTRKLECGHVIHETCYKNFKRYIENNNEERGMKCPICRRNLKMNKSIRREAKKRAKKAVITTPYVFVVVFAILLF